MVCRSFKIEEFYHNGLLTKSNEFVSIFFRCLRARITDDMTVQVKTLSAEGRSSLIGVAMLGLIRCFANRVHLRERAANGFDFAKSREKRAYHE